MLGLPLRVLHRRGTMVKRRDSAPEHVPVNGLHRIEAEEARLRREKIALLRQELAKHREAVRQIEHELRALGDRDAMRTVGWVNWEGVYDQLPTKFSARQVAVLAGVGPAHVASVMHRWKGERRITTTGRGQYRKVTHARQT